MSSPVLLVTCEHAGRRIPANLRHLFTGQAARLDSHRAWDPGALALARTLADALGATLHYATVSRLVVDLNRSPGHPHLYSDVTRRLPAAARRQILERHYLPYRRRVEAAVSQAVASGRRLLHVSAHSFTPLLDGVPRNADVGLLYDPRRRGEAQLCRAWAAVLKRHAPGLRVRRNYPYRGRADGLTAYLRRHFPEPAYLGIELEVSQGRVYAGGPAWAALQRTLATTLTIALDAPETP